MSEVRTDLSTADGDDMAVWGVEGYEAENLDPIKAGDVMYAPGTEVTFEDEHEMYPGEDGIVQGVGMGKGLYSGETYDVLPEGCDEAERVSVFGISA